MAIIGNLLQYPNDNECSTLVGMIMPPPSTTAIQDKAQAALQQQQPLNQKHQVAGPPMTSVYSLGQRDLGKPQAPLYITAGQSRS